MQDTLSGLEEFARNYIDDVLIASYTNKEASWLHAELFLCWCPCGYLNNTWCAYGHHMASMWKPWGVL